MDKILFDEFIKWANQKFPTSTPESCLAHLKEEIRELEQSMIDVESEESTLMELADCFMLLSHCASLMGLTHDHITAAVSRKFEIVKTRKYGPVNEKGFRQHIKE